MQRTPLHIAVKEFRVKTAVFLVDNNADINTQDNDGVSMWDYCLMIYTFSKGIFKPVLYKPAKNWEIVTLWKFQLFHKLFNPVAQKSEYHHQYYIVC